MTRAQMLLGALLVLGMMVLVVLMGGDPDDAAAASAAVGVAPSGAKELSALRTRHSDTFRLSNGRMLTRVYSGSVNYRDDGGDLQPIDDDLTPAADGSLSNEANRYDVTLPKDLSDPVSVALGSDSVAFSLEGAAGTRSSDGSEASYQDALHGVDAQYTAGSDSVKEDLVLADASATRSFSFSLDPSAGVTPSLNKAGGVDFVSGGNTVMSFAAPVMTDADGAISTDLRYTLKHGSPDHWTLDLDADSPWLEKPERTFPVSVDPTTYFGDNFDTYIANGNDPPNGANAQYGPQAYTTVSTGGDRVRRALYRFNFSGIPNDAVVESSSLHLHTYGGAGTGAPIEVHELTHAFTTSATWNKFDGSGAWQTPGGEFEPQALDTVNVGADGFYVWSIGNAVQDWVSDPTKNFGLLLKAPSESTGSSGQGASFNGVLNGADYPYLDVNWEQPTGTLPQWTFDSQRLSDRSSLKVNVATGNLAVSSNDVTVAGVGGMGLNLTRSYNVQSGWGSDFGYNWLMNGGADMFASSYNNGATVMVHGPGDVYWRFRKHYTSSGSWDGSYDAPPGVNATLTDVTGGRKVMLNRSGETWFFSDASGFDLAWMKDRNGHQVTFNYSGIDKVSSVTDTQGRTYTYHRGTGTFANQVTSITDLSYPGGTRTWSYGYTVSGGINVLTSYTDPNNKTTAYDYGGGSDLQKITDPRGNETRITYSYFGGYAHVRTIKRVTNATTGAGPITLYCYDTANKQTTVYDPDGTGQSVGANDCTSPTTNEMAHKTVYSYGSPSSGVLDYDAVSKVTNQIGEDASTMYSPNGDTSDVIGQSQSGSGVIPGMTHNVFDGNFNTKETDSPAGEKSFATFDTSGSQPDHKYLMTGSTDGAGSQRGYGYDAAGNVNSVTTPNLMDSATLAYTDGSEAGSPPVGLVKSATDGNGHKTGYLYYGSGDGVKTGDLKEIQPPLIGAVNPGDEKFDYDSESRLIKSTDAKGAVISYGYDALDRLCVEATGTQTLTCASTPTGSWFKYTYDENGNLKTRTDSASHTSTFTYDALNRRTGETVAGSAKTYGYDDLGNLSWLADAWGTTNYDYFPDNRLKKITDPGSQAVSYAYNDTASPRTQTITYPGATGTLTSSLDLSGKPTAIDAKTTGTNERKLAYSYIPSTATGAPPGELVKTEAEYQNGSGTAATTWSYRYDTLDRLCAATTATLPGACPSDTTVGTAGVFQYLFDKASNRLARWNGTTRTSYKYDVANELCWSVTGTSSNACTSTPTGGTGYTHDNDGERTAPGTLSYDGFQRLTNIGGSNALSSLSPSNNELVGDGTTTLTNSLIGLDSSTASSARTDYIRDPVGTLIGEHTTAGTRYVTPDVRGSTRWIWNGSTVDKTYTYDPDGVTTGSGSGADSKIRYAGGYLAAASSSTPLYHYGARYYDPASSRWTQRDGLEQSISLLQANGYGYASGDPINDVDPAGTCAGQKGAQPGAGGDEPCIHGEKLANGKTAPDIRNHCNGKDCIGIKISLQDLACALVGLAIGEKKGAGAGLICAGAAK